MAVVFGSSAHRLAQTQAEVGWYKHHLPSVRVIQAVMQSYGFLSVQDPMRIARVQRGMPADVESVLSISRAGEWVTFLMPASETQPLFVYCRDCRRLPTSEIPWVTLGEGWLGLEALMAELERAPSAVPQVRGGALDHREIRY